jgi:NifU-like protein involved in Fe-S cluster formation
MPQSDSSYSQEVLDHFLHPRNVGTVDNASAAVEIENEICGDRLELSASVVNGRIAMIMFRSQGCAVAIASASKLTEAVKGWTVMEADQLARSAVASIGEGTHNEKQHCQDIVLQAWQQLLAKISLH